MILNHVKTSYSKHQKLALMTKAQSLVLLHTKLTYCFMIPSADVNCPIAILINKDIVSKTDVSI